MPVNLLSSGGGTTTLTTAASASNFTITLPAATGTTALLDGSNNLSVAGNLSFNSGYGSATVAYGCRAWVNFNGTGTVAIRASGNVSSITDNGTGDYTVNFTTAMPDANYSVAGSTVGTTGGSAIQNTFLASGNQALSAGNVRVRALRDDASVFDVDYCSVSIFR